MDRQNLITELKSVVSVGTVAVQKENAWMSDFLQYAVDSIDFSNQEKSEASQAVTIFVSLCRDAGLWGAKVTPLSFRRKCKKEGKEESSLVTTLCRLEGKIRDMFRLPRNSNGNTSNDNTSNGNTSNGNTSNGNTSNGNTSNGNSSEGDVSSEISDTVKRKYRTEGKLIILGALKRWIEDSGKLSKKSILAEIERMEQGLLKQEEAA